MAAIVTLAVIFGVGWLYYSVKIVAKRNIVFKDQYEQQRALTHSKLVLTTVAPLCDVQSSLAHHIPDDRSARATFFGGAMRATVQHPNRIVYEHIAKISTGGDGDWFTASVTFESVPPTQLRAVVSIDRWREKDGVTRRAGIDAMQSFVSAVVTAFRAVDPDVQVSH